MGLKLLIENEGEILLEVPLFPDDWQETALKREVEQLRRDVQRHMKFYAAFTNENRVRMLQYLLEGEDHTVTFKAFRDDLGLNPKVIRENAVKLQDIGLVESPCRGAYRLSRRGQGSFMLMLISLRRLMQAMMEDEDE
jgi:hypothetical protein